MKDRFLEQLVVWGVPVLIILSAVPILARYIGTNTAKPGRCEVRRERIAEELGRAEAELASVRGRIAARDHLGDPQYYPRRAEAEQARIKVLIEEIARPCP